MVKKLFKHETVAWLRGMLPMYAILLGVALLGRIVQIFEDSSSTPYNIFFTSSTVVYCITIIVCMVMTAIFCITRFYKNLFTSEGYLSFTLPVTTANHLLTKLITALLFSLVSLAVIFISFFIFMFGDAFTEITKTVSYLSGRAFNEIGLHYIFYVIEIILLVIVVCAAQYLLFYACISVGQIARKNRILAAFGVYFGYYFATQMLGTIFIIVVTVNNSFFEKIYNYIVLNLSGYAFLHIILCSALIFELLLGCLYYAVSHHMIKKKLNLE